MKKKQVCFDCLVPLRKVKTKIRGIEMDSSECPKCGAKVFTEEQATEAALKVDAQRLKKQYSKKMIKIGNSWGLTFPKGLADVFRLNNNKTKMTLIPNLKENIIEIKIEN
ncbi:MAG: hypothetical protein Q8O89_05035 [Nanoarchaeota archaeon]|nr:hypothetical protein [Nanoarchaeota archaeon]